jgi:endogenous inhibitor of DNA gyrase (YacG/DUF329 family)
MPIPKIVKIQCPICKEKVELKEILPGLNIHECPNCKKPIVWNFIGD